MTNAVIELIKDFISSSAGTLNTFFDDLFYYIFFIEQQLGSIDFNSIYRTIYSWALIILIIMFIKKMIQTYFLFKTGEEEQSPVRVVVGLLEAVVIMITFGWIYTYSIEIGYSLYKEILNVIGIQSFDINDLTDSAGNGLFAAVISIILAIQLLGLFWQFIKRGIELLILRCTMPFYCIGLLNSNGGAFSVAVKKFMQHFFTVVMQLILLFIALILCKDNQYIYAIAVLLLAISPHEFMQEFLTGVAGMGVGAMIGKASQFTHHASSNVRMAGRAMQSGFRGMSNTISGGTTMAGARIASSSANGGGALKKAGAAIAGFAQGSGSVIGNKVLRGVHTQAGLTNIRNKANSVRASKNTNSNTNLSLSSLNRSEQGSNINREFSNGMNKDFSSSGNNLTGNNNRGFAGGNSNINYGSYTNSDVNTSRNSIDFGINSNALRPNSFVFCLFLS